ncbi:hypothetical protein BD309DRAFT_871377 [Dichomitus squalens]|uniref:Uncharacterized protein n=2 Tax=Dichomitus squalens TaxID=114155 RepID=A0A4Q9NHB0_9APHY|nr:uncharacterized protein DICSQDRAFT_147742 [Dichomitus squalens LYAD-421 SS1]EJF60495.1 hypothetical protein DICSQDRAFT_147742 [Dichomitus squalens LYAD-421 SS1]TBU23082.1 hypothetical protein BD311DRAFT_781936 [Dichomitus squalens]TBU39875.1 hypothetical protein BD309DRAFT_871377 [Dichomitus squalens]TBU52048.1 hypothetical protein BD310DRAFT_833048 [Dichomitus squalens]
MEASSSCLPVFNGGVLQIQRRFEANRLVLYEPLQQQAMPTKQRHRLVAFCLASCSRKLQV